MAGDQHVVGLAPQPISHALGAVVRLQIGGGAELRERVARAPEFLRSLPGPQLAAVPHDVGPRPASSSRGGDARRMRRARRRQRPTSIDVRADRVGMVDQE